MKCRIVHFSDTHGMHEQMKLPDGDVLVFSGDCSSRGAQPEVERFFKWFTRQPHIYKVFVPGNHDRCFDRELLAPYVDVLPFWVQNLVAEYNKYDVIDIFKTHGSFYIQEFDLRFFASAFTPKVHAGSHKYWGFSKEREEMGDIWKAIPENTDVLITHGPPFGKLDFSFNGDNHVGCERLRYKVERIKPKVHMFGHIHEAYGATFNGDTFFLNSSAVNYSKDLNKAQVVDIDVETKAVEVIDY